MKRTKLEERKQFFFGKKNQKTFSLMARRRSAFHDFSEAIGAKVFWFFFSKKNCFLSDSHSTCGFTTDKVRVTSPGNLTRRGGVKH
jgi:hypothetical protein